MATVAFVVGTVTVAESSEDPVSVCLEVTGEFAGRSVDLSLDGVNNRNQPGQRTTNKHAKYLSCKI